MNSAELRLAAERMALFEARGLSAEEAEQAAMMLVWRDREGDTKGLCAECARLAGDRPGKWRCTDRSPANEVAGLLLAAVFVHEQLHRCCGFRLLATATPMTAERES
jgi:hypothetical protein